eukprot:TRINITY_DN29937_c0_g1_i1.p1 TRINITY_DN29937_c0_g1~~TRINITY_DN29937_c0_g1_i1.p1  ORF type:complete len:120 (+),score=0.76 TRINITY_DN29937_c0_g1_i1:47-406(+)
MLQEKPSTSKNIIHLDNLKQKNTFHLKKPVQNNLFHYGYARYFDLPNVFKQLNYPIKQSLHLLLIYFNTNKTTPTPENYCKAIKMIINLQLIQNNQQHNIVKSRLANRRQFSMYFAKRD